MDGRDLGDERCRAWGGHRGDPVLAGGLGLFVWELSISGRLTLERSAFQTTGLSHGAADNLSDGIAILSLMARSPALSY